jgi:hypothetical protein
LNPSISRQDAPSRYLVGGDPGGPTRTLPRERFSPLFLSVEYLRVGTPASDHNENHTTRLLFCPKDTMSTRSGFPSWTVFVHHRKLARQAADHPPSHRRVRNQNRCSRFANRTRPASRSPTRNLKPPTSAAMTSTVNGTSTVWTSGHPRPMPEREHQPGSRVWHDCPTATRYYPKSGYNTALR